MGMEKAIASGKEHRKEYFKKCEQVDKSCRCHGGCQWCLDNRMYHDNREKEKMLDKMKEWEYNNRK